MSKYGSHKVFIKSLGYEIEFCNACGEHIMEDGICSNNTMCPDPIEDIDPEIERQIDENYEREKLFNPIKI